jgi:hypothetical protein
MKSPLNFVLSGIVFTVAGANLFAQSVTDTNSSGGTNAAPSREKWHTITVEPRTDLPKIHFYEKLNPVWWLKNRDDPTPPGWYKPDDRHRRLKWSFRNPFHNFNFYVIGVADKKFYRSGRYPESVMNPHGGWDFEAARYKFFWLPFVSYHREKFDFYFGWRNHGNFGIKLNVNPTKPPKKN